MIEAGVLFLNAIRTFKDFFCIIDLWSRLQESPSNRTSKLRMNINITFFEVLDKGSLTKVWFDCHQSISIFLDESLYTYSLEKFLVLDPISQQPDDPLLCFW